MGGKEGQKGGKGRGLIKRDGWLRGQAVCLGVGETGRPEGREDRKLEMGWEGAQGSRKLRGGEVEGGRGWGYGRSGGQKVGRWRL